MNTRVKTGKKIFMYSFGGIALVVFLYIGYCFLISSKIEKSFNAINIGEPESSVIDLLGEPAVREKQGVLFNRYATTPCLAPCIERLWFENRIALDVEAWSIELDQTRHVIKKYHWVSP